MVFKYHEIENVVSSYKKITGNNVKISMNKVDNTMYSDINTNDFKRKINEFSIKLF